MNGASSEGVADTGGLSLFSDTLPINCQVWAIFELLFGSMSLAAASLLIIIRIIAIWDRNRIAVGIALCAWNANVALLIHCITRVRVAWVPEQSACGALNTDRFKLSVTGMFITDVALLLIVLVGLLRLRLHIFGLGQLLWRQGLIWLLLATAAEGLPTVFLLLNLNDPLNLMFQPPAVIVMSITVTRMHRSLTDFNHSMSLDTYSTQREQTANSDPNRRSSAPIPLDRVEVALHTSSGDCLPAKTSQYELYGSHSAHTQPQDKPLVLGMGSDLESGVERE